MKSSKSSRQTSKNKRSQTTGSSTETQPAYGNALLEIIKRRLESSSKRRAYVPPEQLARALRANPALALPPAIHEYLCDFLEGNIQAPAGRQPDGADPIAHIRKALIPLIYRRY